MTPDGPQFLHISPDWCGEERLAQIFRRNGLSVLHHDGGALAETLMMARAKGQKPPRPLRDANLLTGLHRVNNPARPPLEAWRALDYLVQSFPKAYFILTTRDLDGWILDRMTRDAGVNARCYAHHLDLPEEALPDRWRRDWQEHLAAIDALFGDDPRLIRVDMEQETPTAFGRRLGSLLALPFDQLPDGDSWQPEDRTPLDQRLAASMDRPRPGPEREDPELVEDLARFCLKGLGPGGAGIGDVSGIYVDWDGRDGVRDRKGAPLPFAIGKGAGGGTPIMMTARGHERKWARPEGVMNDVLRLGRADPLRIDMQDARRFNEDPAEPPSLPILAYNRREGARNIALWPLPGQHEIAAPGQPCAESPDRIPFDEKEDRLVWRGHISGSALPRDDLPRRPVHQLLSQLRAVGENRDQQAETFARLCDVPRLAFLRRWIDHPDFDIGMVLAWRFRDLASHPLLAPYARPRAGGSFFQRFRYQLTLAGYDHGSNFIGAINSNSVLLKEEDGWEVYYSGRFTPWVHYIPVSLYCVDLEEKLAWARANPERCKEMSAAARAEVARLANPVARRQALNCILDGLAALR
ncbi:glycosyl transferase family 90 [uncultured Paracoccus sp.]|uniref:glycosyl transferase family 90 n=1 Tax=uncultured Paracoccus sp. TaxID=189685 RepID=UPI0026079D52|nr:glycosyl transferase family 90 [uncultured Paracoccus sp.]